MNLVFMEESRDNDADRADGGVECFHKFGLLQKYLENIFDY